MTISVNTKRGCTISLPGIFFGLSHWVQHCINFSPFACIYWLCLPVSCRVVYSLPVWRMVKYSLSSSLLLVLLSSLSLCLFQPARQGEDYPSSGFPLEREWAAFELSLTEASSHSSKLLTRHEWLRHMGWAANRVMSETDKRKRSGAREGSGSEGGDKQDKGLCFGGGKLVHSNLWGAMGMKCEML